MLSKTQEKIFYKLFHYTYLKAKLKRNDWPVIYLQTRNEKNNIIVCCYLNENDEIEVRDIECVNGSDEEKKVVSRSGKAREEIYKKDMKNDSKTKEEVNKKDMKNDSKTIEEVDKKDVKNYSKSKEETNMKKSIARDSMGNEEVKSNKRIMNDSIGNEETSKQDMIMNDKKHEEETNIKYALTNDRKHEEETNMENICTNNSKRSEKIDGLSEKANSSKTNEDNKTTNIDSTCEEPICREGRNANTKSITHEKTTNEDCKRVENDKKQCEENIHIEEDLLRCKTKTKDSEINKNLASPENINERPKQGDCDLKKEPHSRLTGVKCMKKEIYDDKTNNQTYLKMSFDLCMENKGDSKENNKSDVKGGHNKIEENIVSEQLANNADDMANLSDDIARLNLNYNQKKAILFLHDRNQTRYDNFEFLTSLKNLNYTILVPDISGFAETKGRFSFQRSVNDIQRCLDFLSSYEVTIIGVGFGALLVMNYSSAFFDYKTVLINPCRRIKNPARAYFPIGCDFSLENSDLSHFKPDKTLVFCVGQEESMVVGGHIGCKIYRSEGDTEGSLLCNDEVVRKIDEFVQVNHN